MTVGYGSDEAMFDSWSGDVEWSGTVPPQDVCTRFRIFYPDGCEISPRIIVDVMAGLGAWHVRSGNAAAYGSYDHRDRLEVHYLWPESHPIEDLLLERLQDRDAVAPDGG